jgi:hypothetical protein
MAYGDDRFESMGYQDTGKELTLLEGQIMSGRKTK